MKTFFTGKTQKINPEIILAQWGRKLDVVFDHSFVSPLSVPMAGAKRKAAAVTASQSSTSEDIEDTPGLHDTSDDDDDGDDERAGEGEDEDDDGDGEEGLVTGSSSSSSANSSSSSARRNTNRKSNGKGKGVPKSSSTRKKRAEMITLGEAEEAAADIDSRKIHKDTRARYQSNLRAIKDFAVEKMADCLNEKGELPCPLQSRLVSAFFGTLAKAGTEMEKLNDPSDLKGDEEKPLSVSHLQGHGSAILYHYTENGRKVVDDAVALVIKRQVDGYEKLITRLKQKGLYKSTEGRVPLLLTGLKTICMCFAKKEPMQRGADNWATFVFGWSFLTLMWSLMSRSDNVDKLCLHHLRREGDSIIVTEQGSKSDQKGEKVVEKHVYANPYEPAICPFLTLALWTFMRPAGGTQQLYPGSDSKGRFCSQLQSVLADTDETQRAEIGEIKDVGAHSSRKGGASTVLSQAGGPAVSSVCHRMSQNMGLQSRYLFSLPSGDSVVGRMVTGLPFTDFKFAVLPPHFNTATTGLLTVDFWRTIVPGYDDFPTSFKGCLPFLLASLLHHEQWLRENLCSNHGIFSCPVFTLNCQLMALRAGLLLGIGKCDDTGMVATGIPPHLAIAKEVNALTVIVELLSDKYGKLEDFMANVLPGRISEHIRASVNIEGDQVQLRDLDQRDLSMRTFIGEQFAAHRALQEAQIASNAAVLNAANQRQNGVIENGWWQKWGEFGFGDGKYTPPNWIFPKGISAKAMWMMWLFGNQGDSIRPYRLLRRQIDVEKRDHVQHCRAQGVMKFLIRRINEHCAEQNNLFHPEDLTMRVDKMNVVQSDLAFNTMFNILHSEGFFGVRGGNEVGNRAMYMTYGTMFNLLKDFELANGDRHKRVRKK